MTVKQTLRAWWWRFADACAESARDMADVALCGAAVLCLLAAFGTFLQAWSFA